MILADTSAWIEYDRSTGTTVDRRMTELIAAEASLAVTEPVMMEVLAGARDQSCEGALRRLLFRFDLLHFDALADFDAAVRIYRRCRQNGITPRGLLDCMIAAVAWRHGATVLAYDVDLDRVAGVIGLEIDALDTQLAGRQTTSNSPMILKASSPSCAATPTPPTSISASACCGCSSRTS